MQFYRCHFLDAGNNIVQVEERGFDDDTAAVAWAESICDQHPGCTRIEVWCGDRIVHHFDLAL